VASALATSGLPRPEESSEPERSLRLLRALIQRAGDMVSVVGSDGALRFHYPPALLGYDEGENFGRGVLDFVHPDDRDAAANRFLEALERPGVTGPFVCRIRDATGAWRWMEIVATNLLEDPVVDGMVLNGRDITERHDAEEALKRSESRFRSLVQHGSELVAVWDPRGVLSYASPSTSRFALREAGATWARGRGLPGGLVHPDDRERIASVVREVTDTPGATRRFEARLRQFDGEYRSLQIVLTNLIHDDDIQGIVANARDITEQLEARAALEQNERRWAALVRHSYDIIAVLDAEGILHFASLATEEMLGYAPESLVGTSAFDLVDPSDLDMAYSTLAGLLEHPETPARLELRIRHADGSLRHLEVAASNFLDDPAVGGIVLNNRDVTDRHRAEEERRASEELFRSLVQHGYDLIAVVDRDIRVRYVSPSVAHVMGYQPEDLVGEISFPFVHPHDVGALASHLDRVAATAGLDAPMELRCQHGDGTWRWLEVACTNQLANPFVAGFVLNFRDITERKEAETQLAHQALHDSLTGLPNRALVTDRLAQALARAPRERHSVGVLFVDIDRFKLVNDTRGHEAGDALLVAVARRIARAVRATDTVGRFGGDEFVIVYEGIETPDQLVRYAERICTVVTEPHILDDVDLYATISAGVSIGGPDSSAEALLRDADAAMYHAKENGGDTVSLFNDSIRVRAANRFDTERELRSALVHDEFALEYQPIVSLDSLEIVGVEALLRWDHPKRGTIQPGAFVELAEETGLIIPIERRARRLALRQLAAWRCREASGSFGMSLNVSATQLRDAAGFADGIRRSLQQAGIDPSMLTLELTESFLLEDSEACLEALAALKDLGVHLAVDDFGTRYSSLGYLNRMSLDGIKIDRSFVERLGPSSRDQAIVAAVIRMAHTLGLSVVAEGVETTEQLCILRKLGCTLGQGFLFSRPLRPDVATGLIASGHVSVHAAVDTAG